MDPNITNLFIAIASALIGGFLGHYLTKDRDTRMRKAILAREAEIRRREFRRIISRYCSRIERPATPDHAPEEPWQVFNEALTAIISEASMCEGDFVDGKALDDAIRSATSLCKSDAESRMNKTHTAFRSILSDELARILNAAK
jgi:hypothetical protein